MKYKLQNPNRSDSDDDKHKTSISQLSMYAFRSHNRLRFDIERHLAL
jgi:hypothetical protein